MKCGISANRSVGTGWFVIIGLVETMLFYRNGKAREIFVVKTSCWSQHTATTCIPINNTTDSIEPETNAVE